jgi:hypothetical protein
MTKLTCTHFGVLISFSVSAIQERKTNNTQKNSQTNSIPRSAHAQNGRKKNELTQRE